jgi:hypothetical protein
LAYGLSHSSCKPSLVDLPSKLSQISMEIVLVTALSRIEQNFLKDGHSFATDCQVEPASHRMIEICLSGAVFVPVCWFLIWFAIQGLRIFALKVIDDSAG